ncbi:MULTISPECIES: isochorismate synthase [Heyndrickxia]|uniref:isochorismate synthase n=1 Tax=Heyndrickxia TaxID=2837504 RepID=UPI001B26F840|nr:isochorismate synthase [Heyndrickxia oleronia]GIN42408.1 isochorismate synthase MenF [Heyndrickxia oleronia]
MTSIQHSKIETEFEIAVGRAKDKEYPILFSYTEILNNMNPLSFYSSAKQLFQGKRFFWKVPDDETIIVGLGSTYTLQTSLGEHRFETIQSEWNDLIKDAHIFNPYNVQGTGPLIFGGFSFDPDSVEEPEWSSFTNALFHLPELMLVIDKQGSYLTINIRCSSIKDKDRLAQLLRIKEQILSSSASENILKVDIHQEEEVNPDAWKKAVANVVRLLNDDNEVRKVVMARKMNVTFNGEISSDHVLNHLWNEQHESFIFALEWLDSCFTGASPERLVKKIGDNILSACIAGSIKRDKDEKKDVALGQALLNDDKNRQEHQFVVSMIQEIMNKYCQDLEIAIEPTLMKMRDIQHLFTPVKGTVKNKNTSILSIAKDLHPTPAMGGVPTTDAMQIIREVENMDRGFYAAPIGWLDYQGNGEFAVGIRSSLIKGKEAFLYAGCGVVADSIPEDEYFETRIKFRPMLRALGGKQL